MSRQVWLAHIDLVSEAVGTLRLGEAVIAGTSNPGSGHDALVSDDIVFAKAHAGPTDRDQDRVSIGKTIIGWFSRSEGSMPERTSCDAFCRQLFAYRGALQEGWPFRLDAGDTGPRYSSWQGVNAYFTSILDLPQFIQHR